MNPWAPRVDRIRSSAAGIDHPWIVADIRVPVVDAAEERFLAKEKLLASNLLQKESCAAGASCVSGASFAYFITFDLHISNILSIVGIDQLLMLLASSCRGW